MVFPFSCCLVSCQCMKKKTHYVKSFRNLSYSCSHFPADQNNSEYEHFSRSDPYRKKKTTEKVSAQKEEVIFIATSASLLFLQRVAFLQK